MNPSREGLAAGVLALGCGVAGACYWALLNVPESNVLALTLSGLLVVLIVAAGAMTTAVAVVVGDSTGNTSRRRLGAASAGFLIGTAIFFVLCYVTGSASLWWTSHRGEIDALFLRYGGITRIAWLHQAEAWLLFLCRWALAVSITAALVAAGAAGGGRALPRGLRASVRPAPLASATAGVLVISQILWRLVYWRPRALPPTRIEPAFVGLKLAVLFSSFALVLAFVLAVHRRHATSSRPAAPA